MRHTSTQPTKGLARDLLERELRRVRQRQGWAPPPEPAPLVSELVDRWLATRTVSLVTVKYNRVRLQRLVAAYGDAYASDLGSEELAALLASQHGLKRNYLHDQLRTWRQMFRWAVRTGIMDSNPAAHVQDPGRPIRGENILPFEDWSEVEAVAAHASHWGPLIIFMADSGARPAEALALEHRHVRGCEVELPGSKTDTSQRVVTLTGRGADALAQMPRAIGTRKVFHVEGRPVSWPYFTRAVWRPALEAAGLEYRAAYNLRHTFACWSLRAGVPIATVAAEMGHASTERTFRVYSTWHRERGAGAAALRESWANRLGADSRTQTPAGPVVEPES